MRNRRSPRAGPACLLVPAVQRLLSAQHAVGGLPLRDAVRREPSADRMVAEWMLRMGGSVVLEGQRKPITDLADLPDDRLPHSYAEFHRHHDVRRVAAGRAAPAPALPHLKELYINGRLWYDQPAPRVQATISLFNDATRSRSS